MAFFLSDAVKDLALNDLVNNCDKMVLLSADPANNLANADTANGSGSGLKIAEVAMAPGDFTLQDGATDGRRVTVSAKASVSVTADGDATHVALLDTGTRIQVVTELQTNRTGLTTAGTVDFGAIDITIRDAIEAT